MFNFRKMKKLISGLLIGSGVGILLILFLPANAWPVLIGFALIFARHMVSFQLLI
jgi:uncharacterized membrane protein YfcA